MTDMMKNGNRKRTIWNTWPILCLMAFVLMYVGLIAGTLLMRVIHGGLKTANPVLAGSDVWMTGIMYLVFIGIWIFVFGYAAISRKNRYLVKMISPKIEGNTWKNAAIGLLIGFGLNGVCILAAWLHGDIALTFKGFSPVPFLLIFLCVFVQCAAEELIFRGYLYHKLMESYRRILPALLNALLFGAVHLFNDGVTALSFCNVVLMGVLLTVPMYYMKNGLWCAFGMHTAWNFSQSILFGLPNSGEVFPYSVFELDASTAVNSFAYNVGFGVEGTLLASLLIGGTSLIWVTLARKKNIQPEILADIVKQPQSAEAGEKIQEER